MNKRQAKRRARYLAACLVEGAIVDGIEAIYTNPDGTELPFDDRLRVEDALREVVEELFHRSSPDGAS
jgi:hypothetical protein